MQVFCTISIGLFSKMCIVILAYAYMDLTLLIKKSVHDDLKTP